MILRTFSGGVENFLFCFFLSASGVNFGLWRLVDFLNFFLVFPLLRLLFHFFETVSDSKSQSPVAVRSSDEAVRSLRSYFLVLRSQGFRRGVSKLHKQLTSYALSCICITYVLCTYDLTYYQPGRCRYTTINNAIPLPSHASFITH